MLSDRTAARRVHLRSYSGRNAGATLACCPTCPEFTITPHLFRTVIFERLCLPFHMTDGRCERVMCAQWQGEQTSDANRSHRWQAERARQMELLAQDLPCYGGVHLAVDLTCEREAHCRPWEGPWTRMWNLRATSCGWRDDPLLAILSARDLCIDGGHEDRYQAVCGAHVVSIKFLSMS